MALLDGPSTRPSTRSLIKEALIKESGVPKDVAIFLIKDALIKESVMQKQKLQTAVEIQLEAIEKYQEDQKTKAREDQKKVIRALNLVRRTLGDDLKCLMSPAGFDIFEAHDSVKPGNQDWSKTHHYNFTTSHLSEPQLKHCACCRSIHNETNTDQLPDSCVMCDKQFRQEGEHIQACNIGKLRLVASGMQEKDAGWRRNMNTYRKLQDTSEEDARDFMKGIEYGYK
jgi:hypothetical protein